MEGNMKWIIPTVLAVLFAIGFIVILVIHLTEKKNTITRLDLKYSSSSNIGMKAPVTIEAYLVENNDVSYLFIPGKGTQNAFAFSKLAPGSTNEPSELKSDFNSDLSKYSVDTSSKQLSGYFNNCAILQWATWSISNGSLSCSPFIFDSSSGTIREVNQKIDLTSCGGSGIPVGSTIMPGFGASVIPLKKN